MLSVPVIQPGPSFASHLAMSTDLGVEFFIKFHDLDPWEQRQCIFFVKPIRKDRRCKLDCHDIARARKLRQTILESESEDISSDDLIEYIRCNCCAGRRLPKVNHRNSIEDVDLLIPLAERWLDEILLRRRMDDIERHAAERPTPTTPARTSQADQWTPSSYTSSATSTPTHTITVETPMTSPSYHCFGSPPPFKKPDASPTPASRYSPIPSATQHTSQHVGAHTRYDLRPREIYPVTGNVSRLSARPALPRFRIYIESPSSEHAISWQMCQRLGAGDKPRDYETGSLYIYDRTSTPGYVKIGWTARSVKDRLEDWSKCGYVPNELFRATEVPYAQRVETLTHHELVAEWRSEPPCQNCRARTGERVCHSEWFEVGHDRAIKVLRTWVEFFKKAIPYESDGSLKTEWRRVVNALVAKGDNVTGTKLLEHHETSVKERETATKPPSGSDQSSNSMQSALQPQTGWPFKTKTSPSHKSASLPIVRFDNSTFPKTDFVFNTVPVKKFEPSNKPLTSLFGTLSITESAIEDKTLFMPQARPEAGHLVKDASRNEELLPAQIPAPPSPILKAPIEGRDTSVPCEKDVSDALDKLQLGEGDENCDSRTYSVTEDQREENQPSKPSKEMVKVGERKLQHKDVKPTTTEGHTTESRVLEMNEKKPVDESQQILALELAALEIVDRLSSTAGVRSDTLADKSVVGLRVVEEEISPDIDVVSLA